MFDIHSVPLTTLVQEFGLEVAYAATDYEKIRLTVVDVARPGLQLAGYFDHFEPMRLQVMGNVETSFVQKLNPDERISVYDRLYAEYRRLHDYFGRGGNDVMKRLKSIKKDVCGG